MLGPDQISLVCANIYHTWSEARSCTCLPPFNIALEKAIRDSVIQTRGTISFKTVRILAYADDIDLMARRVPGLSEAFLHLEKSARNSGLVIIMHSGKDTALEQDLAIGSDIFKRGDNFKYLGAWLMERIIDQ
jgi:hypothetical protein